MSSRTQSPGTKLVNQINDTAADPTIQWGGSPVNPSGTGIRGADASVTTSVNGTDRLAVSATGVAVTGTLSASGAMTASGALNVVGAFSVATNKLTVAAASGNTVSAGSITGDSLVATTTATAASVAIGGGTAITKVLKGVVSVTISALLTNTQEDVEVTITGVAAGDAISVTPLAAAMETGVAIVGAFQSDTNKIKIRIANVSGGTLTGSTTDFTYLITKS